MKNILSLRLSPHDTTGDMYGGVVNEVKFWFQVMAVMLLQVNDFKTGFIENDNVQVGFDVRYELRVIYIFPYNAPILNVYAAGPSKYYLQAQKYSFD